MLVFELEIQGAGRCAMVGHLCSFGDGSWCCCSDAAGQRLTEYDERPARRGAFLGPTSRLIENVGKYG